MSAETKVSKIKRTDHPDLLHSVMVNGGAIENLIEFVYLGAKLQLQMMILVKSGCG